MSENNAIPLNMLLGLINKTPTKAVVIIASVLSLIVPGFLISAANFPHYLIKLTAIKLILLATSISTVALTFLLVMAYTSMNELLLDYEKSIGQKIPASYDDIMGDILILASTASIFLSFFSLVAQYVLQIFPAFSSLDKISQLLLCFAATYLLIRFYVSRMLSFNKQDSSK